MTGHGDAQALAEGLAGFDRFGADLTAFLSDALGQAGQYLQGQIAERTPVVTGALRASLGCGPVQISGDAQAQTLTVMVGSALDYAPVVEIGRVDGSRAGHRMAATALEQSGPAIASLMEAATLRTLHAMGEGGE